ncbi:MAG: HAD family hydrolase [Candidatus Margulisiibacteriota bacterium]|nr:HAD family hydrolase [Candidatus Margulisiibacteriota bacterium]
MADIKVNGQVIKDIDLVIFDRDGTLIDLYHYWSQMIGKRAELICEKFNLDGDHRQKMMFEMGVDLENKKLRSEGPVGIKKREVVMQAAIDYLHQFGIKDGRTACLEAFSKVDEISRDMLDTLIKVIDGTYDLIDTLHAKGCKTAIATTDKTERAKLSMDFLGLSEKMSFVIGADGVELSKPAPDMIDLISQELKIAKNRMVMVGDAETDIKMGNNAKVKASIAVCSGITPREQLQNLTNYVIDDVSQIKVV